MSAGEAPIKQAVKWIDEQLADDPEADRMRLIDEAGRRFEREIVGHRLVPAVGEARLVDRGEDRLGRQLLRRSGAGRNIGSESAERSAGTERGSRADDDEGAAGYGHQG